MEVKIILLEILRFFLTFQVEMSENQHNLNFNVFTFGMGPGLNLTRSIYTVF